MALLEKYQQLSSDLTTLKESLRAALKSKGVDVPDDVPLKDYANYIELISTGTDTTDATVKEEDLRYGVTAYGSNGKVEGKLHTVQPYVLKATVVIPEGIVESQQITIANNVRDNLAIVPGTTDKNLGDRLFIEGNTTILGDPNLISENIKAGVSIFGVRGTHGALESATIVKSSSPPDLQNIEEGTIWIRE